MHFDLLCGNFFNLACLDSVRMTAVRGLTLWTVGGSRSQLSAYQLNPEDSLITHEIGTLAGFSTIA